MILDLSPNQKLIGIVPTDELPPFAEFIRLAERVQSLRCCGAALVNTGNGVAMIIEGDLPPDDINLALDAFSDFIGQSYWRGRPN